MRQILIIMCICSGLLFSCESNKRSKTSKTFSSRKGNTLPYKPRAANTSDSSKLSLKKSNACQAFQPKTALDSAYLMQGGSMYVKPQTNFQGSLGIGTGGSYASSYYRQESMRLEKCNAMMDSRKITMGGMKSDSLKQNTIPADSLNTDTGADTTSTSYKW